LQRQARDGDIVEADFGQCRAVALTPTRVLVDDVHQLAHGALTVAQHLGWFTAGGGHELVTHHEQAKILSGQKALDHHGAIVGGVFVGLFELRAVGDVDRDALALVAVLGLDDHRQADLLGHGPGLVHRFDRLAQRYGHTGGVQQTLGQVLVLADGFGHGTGGIDFGRLDAPLLGAPTQLHQTALGESTVGDAPVHGGLDDSPRAGAQAHVFVQITQVGNGGFGVEGVAIEGRLYQLPGVLEGLAAHLFLGVFHDDQKHSCIHGGRGARETHRATGLSLQRQRGRLQHMGEREIGLAALGLQYANGGKQRAQASLEAVDARHGAFLRVAGNDGLNGQVAAPEIGPTQGPDAGDIHGDISFFSANASAVYAAWAAA